MVYKGILFVLLLVFLNSCDNTPIERKNPEADKIKVKDYISIDTFAGANKIVLSKMCTESSSFKYMYQLKNGLWIVSNEAWTIGERVILTMQNNEVTEIPNKSTKSKK